ncbi:MAG: hypothetical protein AAB263_10480 [Planctomycetota bacterium]
MLGLAACGTTVPRVDADWAARAGLPQAQLEEGRRLYIASCTGCHPLYPAATHNLAGWTATMRIMGTKARLEAPARAAIVTYLGAAAQHAPR